jgi:hypothetical protein
MRSALIFLVLASAPAFCQETTPVPVEAGQIMNDNLQRRINDILNPQHVQTSGVIVSPRLLVLGNDVKANAPVNVCSIPLLNVKPAGSPVPMPVVRPPQSGPLAPNTIPQVPLQDKAGTVRPPAPACPADFGRNTVPAPVKPAPATAP